jgi:hypothetical protein
MNEKFEMFFINDGKNGNLVSEILFNRQRLCQISRKDENDSFEIKFLTDLFIMSDSVEMKFN